MQNKNFFLAVNKPTNWTSSDVVIKVRNEISKKLNEKIKVGHMGTLDPGAAGVLLLGVNKATRLFDVLLKKEKSYRGELTFGVSTDTLDSYGKIISKSKLPKIEDVLSVLNAFLGEIEQIPPKYSAIKINGQKAYNMARLDKEFEIPKRIVTIFDLKVVSYKENDGFIKSIVLDVKCSSGTYIRTLFNDIAKKLNVDGYMSYLIRTKLANIDINESIPLNELLLNPLKYTISIGNLISNFYNRYDLSNVEYEYIKNGRCINIDLDDECIALYKDDEIKFIAKKIDGKYKSIINLE